MRIIAKERIDIVHGQGMRAEFFARLAARLAGRKPYVSTLAMPVEGYDVGPLRKLLYQALDRFSEHYVNRFIVVSDRLVRTMTEDHRVEGNKVIKIYNGIEIDVFQSVGQSENRQRIRAEFQIPETALLIGAIGRVVWQKGFDCFIRAIPHIAQSLPNSRFMLVGDGALRNDLEARTESLGIQDRVLFTGQRTDVRDVLAALDIVVVPSLQEGFPVLTLEAMAMEKPIVASEIDGITEQIVNGKEGLLVPPKDPQAIAQAVRRLAENPEQASLLGKNARARVLREFSVDKMIAETIGVYESL